MTIASKVYKTEAIVLRYRDMGEADRLVTIHTPFMGKFTAIAKGVRRTKSRLAGHVEPLSYSSMMLAKGQNLDIITQSQTIESFLPLRQDLWRTTCGLYAAELVERFTPEHAEHYAVFRLLLDTLHRLAEEDKNELVLRYFEVQLLGILGYRPELYRCVKCRAALQPVVNYFGAGEGGALCPQCAEPWAKRLSVSALKVLRHLQRGSWEEVRRLNLTGDPAQEVESLLRDYIRYLLERDINAAGLMDTLRREQVAGLDTSAS